jgi:proteasome lid subunit RPN8/RPN11
MTLASTSLSPQEQDLSAIKTGEWGDREFPLGPRERPTRRQVIFKQSVLNDIYAHGRGAPEIEVCGVLVGNVYQDAQGPFVFVEANIRGNFSSGKAAQVTFTAKTWSHIQDVMDKSYPDMRILGWYHTHPGHGIFLSDMDLFIHKNFFSLPWHLAFVFDPQNQEEGLFAWRTGNMAIESFVVQKDAQAGNPKVARRVPDAAPATAATTTAPAAPAAQPTSSVISAPATPARAVAVAATAVTQQEPPAAPAAGRARRRRRKSRNWRCGSRRWSGASVGHRRDGVDRARRDRMADRLVGAVGATSARRRAARAAFEARRADRDERAGAARRIRRRRRPHRRHGP